jgi:hypothetical protein
VIDSSAKRTEMATGQPIYHEFLRYDLPCKIPPFRDDYRVNALKIMLRQGDIKVSEHCPTLIQQLREVEWGQKINDDCADALKYGASMVYRKDFFNVSDYMDGMTKEKIHSNANGNKGLLFLNQHDPEEVDQILWSESAVA